MMTWGLIPMSHQVVMLCIQTTQTTIKVLVLGGLSVCIYKSDSCVVF